MTITRPGPSGQTNPPAGRPPDEVLYHDDRTRVLRHTPADGSPSTIHKQALGAASTARIRHEAAILSRLAHVPGVSVLLGQPGPAELVLRDTGGCPLADLPPARRPTLADLPTLAWRLATILGFVHGAGVVHKNINPGSILLCGPSHEPVLIDFDLATTFAEVRPGFVHHRAILGRLAYLAPEQTGRTGLPVDQRADLYALGCVLYELATGAPPFPEEEPLALLRALLARVPAPLAEVVPGCSPGLSEVVARLLEKEPDRRYQSAAGLVYDLTRLRTVPDEPLRVGERDFPATLTAPSPLFGRADELTQLRAVLDTALHQPGQVLLVDGPAGVGKTTLVNQLRAMVAEAGGWFVTGRAEPHQGGAGSRPLLSALRALGQLLLAEPQAELAALTDRITFALGRNAGLLSQALSEFAALLAASAPADEQPEDPAGTVPRIRQAYLDLLHAIAPDRPIVVFLDDLQWATAGTLGLLDAVLADHDGRGLLLVGAYRPDEVGAGHPLAALAQRWDRDGGGPHRLRLANLPPADLSALLAAMLRLPPAQTDGLADLVARHTGGNPGDTIDLVNALRRDGALRLGATGWRWDRDAIGRYVGSGDVADRLTERITALGERARAVLTVLARLDGAVTLDLLAQAAGVDLTEVEELLAAPLAAGLLVIDEAGRDAPGARAACSVRPRHDRVRDTVLNLLDPPARPDLDLAIARRLAGWAGGAPQAAARYLSAASQLADPAERRQAAHLFQDAASAAGRIGDHATAQRYLRAALAQWTALGVAADDPALCRLESQRHAALYGLGRLDEADLAFERVRARARDPLALAGAVCVQVASLTNRGRPAQALALGLGQLAALGIAAPGPDPAADVEPRWAALCDWIASASVDADLDRPELTEPLAVAAATLCARLAPAAASTDLAVAAWLVTEGHRLWQRYGPSAPLVPVLAHSATVAIGRHGDYQTGQRVLAHILAVGEARRYEPATAQARVLHAIMAGVWTAPLEESVWSAQSARESLVPGGDTQNTALSYLPAVAGLVDCGSTVDGFADEVDAGLAYCRRTGNAQTAAVLQVYRQLHRALRGLTARPGDFTDAQFDEDSHARAHASGNPRAVALLRVLRALSAAIVGDDVALARNIDAAQPWLPWITGTYPLALARLLEGLSRARRATGGAPELAQEHLARAAWCRDWLAERAAAAPANFGHLAGWVAAEVCWAGGDYHAAAAAFDAAIREAERGTRPWHLALMTERAGLLACGYGLERAGRALLTEARGRYLAWGASAKVAQLDTRHGFLRSAGGTGSRSGTGVLGTGPLGGTGGPDLGRATRVSGDTIDMLAILQTARALSSETNLDRLQLSIVDQVRSMTGAVTVEVLLPDPTTRDWYLPAGLDRPEPLGVEEAGARGLLPLTALRYAERTRTPLLVPDATEDDRFARDPYLRRQERCSLLVVPILNQGSLRAILWLDNTFSSAAFAADGLDAVMLIAGQLAVALDNALLYRSLEDKVAARTRELELANEQLAELSATDPLTGVANRRTFDQALATQWRRGLVNAQPVGVVMIDIDHFKWYNDEYGHPTGDECIRQVADALVSSTRQGADVVARYGGEEFAIVLPGATVAAATVVARRARAAVAALARPHSRTPGGIVTVSIGVASAVPDPAGTAAALVQAADAALYRAKNAGRDQVVVAD